MKTKIQLTTIVVAGLATTMAACAGGKSAESAGGSCSNDDPVRMGTIITLSGPQKAVGERFLAGSEMAVEDVNRDGGIMGRCVESVVKDDEGDPTVAAQAARQLVLQEKVDFMEGPVNSAPLAPVMDVTNDEEVLHLTQSVFPPAGNAAEFPFVFRTSMGAVVAADQFWKFAQEAGWKKVAILAVNDAFGTTNTDAVLPGLKAAGIEVSSTQIMDNGQLNVDSQMKKLRDTNPDGVLLFTTGNDLVPPLKAREASGWDVPVLAYTTVSNSAIVDAVGESGMKGVFAGQIAVTELRESNDEVKPKSEPAAAFRDAFKDYLEVETLPDNFSSAGWAYDGVTMAAQAANEVKSMDAAKIKKHLEKAPYSGVMGTFYFDAKSHDGLRIDEVAFAEADSLKDGTLLEAKP